MIKHCQAALVVVVFVGTMLCPALIFAQTEVSTVPAVASSNIETKKSTPPFDIEAEINSLLFSDVDIKAIRSARLFYEQHINGVVNGGIAEDDFLKNLEKITASKSDAESKFFTYPQFFLSSIAYYSPKDWVVWINDEKITQDSGISMAGLRVIEIDNKKITVEWHPENMDRITDEEYSSDNPVEVDFIQNKVIFSLKANQTFTSYAMRVVEGKVIPVTIDLEADVTAKLLEK